MQVPRALIRETMHGSYAFVHTPIQLLWLRLVRSPVYGFISAYIPYVVRRCLCEAVHLLSPSMDKYESVRTSCSEGLNSSTFRIWSICSDSHLSSTWNGCRWLLNAENALKTQPKSSLFDWRIPESDHPSTLFVWNRCKACAPWGNSNKDRIETAN